MILERPLAIFLGVVFLIIFMIVAFIKKMPIGRKILWALCILYITGVISITIFPIIFDSETMFFTEDVINLSPFSTIHELIFDNSNTETVLLQLVGNIIMCVPFGIAFPFIIKHKNIFLYLIDAIIFPVIIEIVQLTICLISNSFYRTIDIDDVILNFVGVLVGYFIYMILPKFTKDFFSKSNHNLFNDSDLKE